MIFKEKTKTFEMTLEQVDALVVGELQDAYERNLKLDTNEGGDYLEPDWELLDSLEKVLAYFMCKSDFDKWMQQAAPRKLALINEYWSD